MSLQNRQTTIRNGFTLSGAGVHSGRHAVLRFRPAEANSGIVFKLAGPDGKRRAVRAVSSEVGSTDFATVLGDPAAASVSTIEHLMAAVAGLQIDNLAVEVDGPEVPILDGSALPFVEGFDSVGLETLAETRKLLRVVRKVRVENGASWAEFSPGQGTSLRADIEFDSPAIGRQSIEVELTPETFRREIAAARTFGFASDVEKLRAAGFAQGASLNNTVAIGEDHRILNPEGLRFADEFVRHKLLDAIGDLSLAGSRLLGRFHSYRGGHRLNALAVRQLLGDPSAFEIVEAPGLPAE